MAKKIKKDAFKDLVRNPKALHDFEIEETFEAGMALKGTEIKSLREFQGSLKEAYVKVIGGEIWLLGAHIPHYKFGNVHNHEEYRDRKLLMHSREIKRLYAETKEKGMAIVPLSVYLKKGRAKLRIGMGRGKKAHDKRQDLRKKEDLIRMKRAVKGDRI